MLLKKMSERFSALPVFEKREDGDEYFEVVFFRQDEGKWLKVLDEILGSPAKTAGEKAQRGDIKLLDPYGGIRKEQTLFKRQIDDVIFLAMLWPWQDDEHVTLKMFFVRR